MSDERFVVSTNDVGEIIVTDTETGNVYHYGSMSNFLGLIRLLNEQQSTIIKQDEEIKKLKRTERSWRRIHCCNKESNNCGIVIEQQATIQSLKEENEQLRKENERQNNEIKLLRKKITELMDDLEKIPPSIREMWFDE